MGKSKISGDKRLKRKFRRMKPAIEAHLKPAMEVAAQRIEEEAATRIPIKEGDLKATIHHKVYKKGLSAKIGWWKKGNKRRWERAGWRSHFIEGGTRGGVVKTGRNKGKKIHAQKARPMLAPALRKRFKPTIRLIDSGVDKALGKVASGG